jgi:hypothetical protein
MCNICPARYRTGVDFGKLSYNAGIGNIELKLLHQLPNLVVQLLWEIFRHTLCDTLPFENLYSWGNSRG